MDGAPPRSHHGGNGRAWTAPRGSPDPRRRRTRGTEGAPSMATHADRPRMPGSDGPSRIERDGTRLLRAEGGKALLQRTLDPGLSPWAAPGAIITLGNAAAVAAGTSALDPPSSEHLPLTTQVSVNLFREASRGTLTAEAATIYRGRSTLVVEVKVRDERQCLVATLVVTQLAPLSASRPPAPAPRLAS